MAKRRKKTAQQLARQKEERNLKRRLNRIISKTETKYGYKVEIDINEYLKNRKKPLTAKQLNQLRGDKLSMLVDKRSNIVFIDSENKQSVVPMSEFKDVVKNYEKAVKLSKKYKSDVEIGKPDRILSYSGYKHYKKHIEKAATAKYWIEKNNRMVDNFMQSFSYLGVNSYGYKLMAEKLNKMSTSAIVDVLRSLVDRHYPNITWYFSSNQSEVHAKINDVFNAFGIPFDASIDYSEPFDGNDYEEVTDEELEDLPF